MIGGLLTSWECFGHWVVAFYNFVRAAHTPVCLGACTLVGAVRFFAGCSSGNREMGLVIQGVLMAETSNCPAEAGSAACELPSRRMEQPARTIGTCSVCGEKGKPVDGQTVKALLSVSLRAVRDAEYLFCRTQSCPIVYFTPDRSQTFTTEDMRERVYQKEPGTDSVFVCYCFRHTVGDVRATSPERRAAIEDDVNEGILVGQCACDVRNPQGSCCLGNLRGLVKRPEQTTVAM